MNNSYSYRGLNQPHPQSKLTSGEASWLNLVRPIGIRYIMSLNSNIKPEDTEEIFTREIEVLSKRGMKDMFSAEKLNEFSEKIEKKQYLAVHREALRMLCNPHLKRRMIDHFKSVRRVGYDERLNSELTITEMTRPGGDSRYNISTLKSIDELRVLIRFIQESPKFDSRDLAIIRNATKVGSLQAKLLYDAMSSYERNLFLPKDGRDLADPKEFIITAIRKRTYVMLASIRKFFDRGYSI